MKLVIEEENNKIITIPVMHCFDNNYVIPAAVSFYSMLENANKNYFYKLYVLHSDITVQNQVKLSQIVNGFPNASLEFINMANRFDDLWAELQFTGHYSKEVLYKLLVPSIFPQYDKIIITDVDVAFMGDISESYFVIRENDEALFAGVHQIAPKGTWLETYYKNYDEHFGLGAKERLKICGGYIVANLAQLRARNMEAKFLQYLKENAYRLLQSEQDVINFCCDDREIKYLPLNYVVCSYQYDIFEKSETLELDPFYGKEELVTAMEKPIQLHYATGIKPWNNPSSTKSDIWYYYLSKCGMFFDFFHRVQALQNDAPIYLTNSELRKGNAENRSPMVVSVLCCTYNHEKFIRDCLEGLVNQKVDFPYEIIIADDGSKDKTQEIIREYHSKFPHLIRPILRENNIGIGPNYYDALTKVSGKFLAICDGDDCWIDMLKIKKQVDFLQSNPECNVCCASCIKHNVDTEEDVLYDPEDYIKTAISLKSEYSFRDLLYCRFVTSNTLMLRWQFRNMVPEFLRYHNVIDFPLVLLHSAGGSVKVMNNEVFARYNLHSKGITSARNSEVEQETFCIINEVNEYLDYRFSKTVVEYMNSYKQYILGVQQAEKAREFESISISNKAKIDFLVQRLKEKVVEKENIKGKYRDDISASMIPNVKINRRKTFKNILVLLYRECVPEILKRVWRLLKRIPVVIYKECVPEILKRVYRKIKIRILKRG